MSIIYARFFYNQDGIDDTKKYDYYVLDVVDGENYKFLIDEMVEKMVANKDFELIPLDYLDYNLKNSNHKTNQKSTSLLCSF